MNREALKPILLIDDSENDVMLVRRAILEWIKTQKALEKVPVVMLTGSNVPEDRRRAEQLGATSFLMKSYDLDQMIALARQIKEKWISQ